MHDSISIDMGVLFDAAPSAQIVITPDLRIVAANRRYCEMLDTDRMDLVGKHVFEAFPANPDDPEANAEEELRASADHVVRTGEAHRMPLRKHDVTAPDGRYVSRYWSILNAPVFADAADPRKVTHIIHTAEDITQTVLGNRVHDAMRRAAVRGADVTYFELDPDRMKMSRTPQLDAMFGLSPDAPAQTFLDRIHPDDLDGVKAEIARVGRTIGADLHHEYRVTLPDGRSRWLIGRGESIRDPQTQGVLIAGILLDVTEVKQSEARLRDALAARDLLIAEVNHRVKNSLQMVTSILHLEARNTEDETARAALAAATARVRAIASIHASLYEDDDVQSVQLDTYLGRLVDHLRTSLSQTGKTARVVLDVEPIRLPTDTAVTLSLAVNELVTNSFKHGGWKEGEGTVTIRLCRVDSDTLALDVSDDGTGSAAGTFTDKEPHSGLGRRLISGMAAQLGGTIEEEQDHGWRTLIRFPG